MIEILHQGEKVRYTQFAAFCHIDRKLKSSAHLYGLVIEMMAISFLHTFFFCKTSIFYTISREARRLKRVIIQIANEDG